MGSNLPPRRRPPLRLRPRLTRAALALAPLLLAVACSGPAGPSAAGPSPSVTPAPGTPGRAASPAWSGTAPSQPVMAAMNQFRDNYSKQTVEIQLTNTTAAPVTVDSAAVSSTLFTGSIGWEAAGGGTELPPGQTKSLPATLPPAACTVSGTAGPGPANAGPAAIGEATLGLRDTAGAVSQVTVPVSDPFGVLTRNNDEQCVAQAAAAVADFRFAPDLRVAADGRAAVVDLIITPRQAGDAAAGQTLTLDGVGGTTLLAEDAAAPWPHGVEIAANDAGRVVPLGLRPARCDPHAVAEDKVGTLIPLHVTVGGREGTLKVGAGAQLRGRIYDFVTAACGRRQ